MTFNKWTVGLLATGVVSLGSAALADESPISSLVSGTTIGGAVDTSAIWKVGPGSTMANRFVNTAPNRYNGFNLENFEFRIEKPLDESQWSAGYKAEMWFGQGAAGLPGSLSEGVAVKQAYAVLRAPVGNGLDIKIGQFDSIIGYEVSSSYMNPNFSRNMGFNIEPFSHTGALASYQVTEWLGVVGGIADTAFYRMNAKEPWASNGQAPLKGDGTLTYMGALTVKAPESFGWAAGSQLYAGIVDGGMSDATDTVNYYVGLSMPTPIKEITVGVAYDYVSDYGAVIGTNATWNQALSGYLSWQLTEKLKLNTRGEWAKGNGDVWLTGGDDNEEILAATVTLEYALWDNVVSRLEGIWEHDLKGGNAFDGNNNAWLLLANIAYKF